MILSEVVNNLRPIIEKYENIRFAYLFGSIAKNDPMPLSDIDIAIFLSKEDKKLYYNLKIDIHADVCRTLKRNDIDVVVINTTNNIMLLEEIIRYGIILFDRNKDLREEFEHKILHRAIDFKEQRRAIVGV